MSSSTPRVSILTAVRDAAPHLAAAVESILSQTLRDWEWILVDDGSTDGSGAALDDWARRDRRLRVVHRHAAGLVAALNAGLDRCRAPLVARMDADDVACPERLAAQVATLATRPEITVVDGRVELVGGTRNHGMHRHVEWLNGLRDHRSIADDIFVGSPIVHPAACFRRDPVRELGGYRAGDFPEDYDLWLRLHARGARFLKLPQAVLRWRDHSRRLTRTDRRYRSAAFTALKQHYLWELEGPAIAGGPLALWGAGRGTRSWRRWLRERPVRPAFIVDANPRRRGQRILDAPVVDAEELLERPWSYLLVTVSSPDSRAAIRSRLRAWHVSGDNGRRLRFV